MLSDEMSAEMAPFNERLETVWRDVEEKSERLDDYLIPRPEAEIDEPDESEWLFDNAREYLEQLGFYKRHQGKEWFLEQTNG